MKLRALFLALAGLALCAFADPVSDQLTDPRAEERAQGLFEQLRCMVCQSESIGASDADLAHDMRMLVRQQVAEGRTNAEIKAYFYQRYGDAILLRPRLAPKTVLLWIGPFGVVLLGVGFVLMRRRREAPLEADLTAAELKALKNLAKDEPQ